MVMKYLLLSGCSELGKYQISVCLSSLYLMPRLKIKDTWMRFEVVGIVPLYGLTVCQHFEGIDMSRSTLWWRQKVPQKHCFICTTWHDIPDIIVTAVRTSDLKCVHECIFAHCLCILLAWSAHILSVFNLLTTDFFQILAHPVFKMWVIQKPNKIALWNKRHFEEKKMEIIQHV